MKRLKRIYQKFVYDYLLDEENKDYIQKYKELFGSLRSDESISKQPPISSNKELT